MNIVFGPAKGWKVTAWLQDIKWHKPQQTSAYSRAVRWHISSPDRSHTYQKYTHLQDEVSEGVYTHIFTAVRPKLLVKINQRRHTLLSRGLRQKRQAQCLEDHASLQLPPPRAQKQARCDRALTGGAPTPQRSSTSAPRHLATQAGYDLATQAFAPMQVTPSKELETQRWNCGCDAHFKRHPHCIAAGSQQPLLVHLRDYMVIGRGDTCDVILDSRRTPQMISRCHVVLNREEGLFTLTDQGSLNGVLVNGERVLGKQALANGDVLTFGVPTPHPELDYVFEMRPRREAEDRIQSAAPLGA